MQLKKAEWREPRMTDEERRIMKKKMAAMRRLGTSVEIGLAVTPFFQLHHYRKATKPQHIVVNRVHDPI